MNNVRIKDAAGRELTVSEKAFELIYKHKGFTLLGPAEEALAPESEAAAENDDKPNATTAAIARSASKALRIVKGGNRRAGKKAAKKAGKKAAGQDVAATDDAGASDAAES